MAKPHKPDRAAPAPKRRAKTSDSVAAGSGKAAAFSRRVSAHSDSAPARAASRQIKLVPAARQPAPRAASRQAAAPPPATLAGAIISRRAADRLRSGHLWVYASDVVAITPPKPEEELLPVADQRGIFLGTALYSPQSQIALRLVAREALDHAAWLKLLVSRLRAAIARRKPLLDADNDACRLCFSEADELPGLVVDKYGEIVVVQRLTKGLLAAGTADTCVRVLREELAPAAIFERPDPRIREIEGLPAPSHDPLWLADPAQPSSATEFHLNGLAFHYDANAGQKTGAFLDQRTNYAAAREWAQRLGAANPAFRGRALDVCCYQGGFTLHLAQVCRQVTGIDTSRASLEVAERNLEANRARIAADVDWIEADAFEILRDWSQAGETFNAIVLDPPAFAKSKRAVEGALRGYKELNLRALKMLRPGGLLVTCSCSHHVGWADLEAAVAAAAADASRRVRLLARRGAAPDHPVVLNLPETEYLKCLVLEVE
jgi:23S rRNA (cytosine1962-C5)-methyltransferase